MKHGVKRPVTIQGRKFPSLKAASRHFGVAPSTIHNAIKRGTSDNIGKGTGKRITVTVEGKTYPSKTDACEALGWSFYRLQNYLSDQRRKS